ncbi:hypothetical protein FWK35_00016080 [Aphis craccivora]|uniref:Uncharacterized protein n=1 Tax=Aphis craccivora TaxID=307492 RepID=A0A6G0ZAI3_APHCR|nr:hypothetical protein FWK35_00016080 [Aphis craccivora]
MNQDRFTNSSIICIERDLSNECLTKNFLWVCSLKNIKPLQVKN